MTCADVAAKPGLETASWLPAHRWKDHAIFPAEQSLQEGLVCQVVAAPPKPPPNPDTRFTTHHPYR